MNRVVAASLMSVVLLAGACSLGSADGPVPIQTNPMSGTCLLVNTYGRLVADHTWGLALAGTDQSGNPHTYGVVWPRGYSARREQDTIVLLDSSGNVVAQEGDQVVLDAANHDPLQPCDDIHVTGS